MVIQQSEWFWTSDGDDEERWKEYFSRAAAWARRHCRTSLPHVDPVDFAQSALRSLIRRTKEEGLTPRSESDALWRLLYRVVVCKVAKAYRRNSSDPVAARLSSEDAPDPVSQGQIECEMASRITEEIEGLEDKHRQVIWLALEGYTQKQIAFKLSCSLSTVKRRWTNIKSFLERDKA